MFKTDIRLYVQALGSTALTLSGLIQKKKAAFKPKIVLHLNVNYK